LNKASAAVPHDPSHGTKRDNQFKQAKSVEAQSKVKKEAQLYTKGTLS